MERQWKDVELVVRHSPQKTKGIEMVVGTYSIQYSIKARNY